MHEVKTLSMMSEIGEHENRKIQYEQMAENLIMNATHLEYECGQLKYEKDLFFLEKTAQWKVLRKARDETVGFRA